MAYYLNLFSPETHEAFSNSSRNISGFRKRNWNAATRIKPGDILLCYLTKVSRWCGAFEILDGPFEDNSPIFFDRDDPFSTRFHIKPVVWLDASRSVPIKNPEIWSKLSFTRDYDVSSSMWTGKFRTSLCPITVKDGNFLFELLKEQSVEQRQYLFGDRETKLLKKLVVHRTNGKVAVTVPIGEEHTQDAHEIKKSHLIQAEVAKIGIRMGFQIWIPNNDRGRICEILGTDENIVLELPFNYNEATLSTIENIDVIWIKRNSIVRAFEVEHTTSIYSGILRMADLLALQPNINLKLHIVAPAERREKVIEQLRRPIFSMLEVRPLSEICTFLDYESIAKISEIPHLSHVSDSIISEYEVFADEGD